MLEFVVCRTSVPNIGPTSALNVATESMDGNPKKENHPLVHALYFSFYCDGCQHLEDPDRASPKSLTAS